MTTHMSAENRSRSTSSHRLTLARAHLRLLFADLPGFVEIRARHIETGDWSQHFRGTTDIETVAGLAVELAASHEVYVGVLPRAVRGGSRADLCRVGTTLWADLDSLDATERAANFEPPPAMLLTSGGCGHTHAYWPLVAPLPIEQIERANTALATRLGADRASTDGARILRLAGTTAHKHVPATVVAPSALLAAGASVPAVHRGGPAEMASRPDLPTPSSDILERLEPHTTEGPLESSRVPAIPHRSRPDARPGTDGQPAGPLTDALESISPEVYVKALTGQEVDARHKVRCPLHDDRTPSLHVYPTVDQGWFCFGCRRGGSVYDLAAALWNRPLRGRSFVELRDDLLEALVPNRRR